MTNDFFEFLNFYMIELDVILLGVTTIYLVKRYQNNCYGGRFFSDYGVGMAIALATYITGQWIIRGWTWTWRFLGSHGWSISSPFQDQLIVLFGLLITTVGMMLLVRRISTVSKPWMWMVIAPIAATISALLAWGI